MKKKSKLKQKKIGDAYSADAKQLCFRWNSHPTSFGVNIILVNIPRHPEICHLTFLPFTNKNISGRQVTMDYLTKNYIFL